MPVNKIMIRFVFLTLFFILINGISYGKVLVYFGYSYEARSPYHYDLYLIPKHINILQSRLVYRDISVLTAGASVSYNNIYLDIKFPYKFVEPDPVSRGFGLMTLDLELKVFEFKDAKLFLLYRLETALTNGQEYYLSERNTASGETHHSLGIKASYDFNFGLELALKTYYRMLGKTKLEKDFDIFHRYRYGENILVDIDANLKLNTGIVPLKLGLINGMELKYKNYDSVTLEEMEQSGLMFFYHKAGFSIDLLKWLRLTVYGGITHFVFPEIDGVFPSLECKVHIVI
jgi:hypothetical protein